MLRESVTTVYHFNLFLISNSCLYKGCEPFQRGICFGSMRGALQSISPSQPSSAAGHQSRKVCGRRLCLAQQTCCCCTQVVQIHERLSPGGILVFVTGQREVEHLCTRLRAKYAKSRHAPSDAAVQPGERHETVNGLCLLAGLGRAAGTAAQLCFHFVPH